MSENPPDLEVGEWLAQATGLDADDVSRQLEEGERRRTFVADELIEAGFAGAALLDGVMRLTGLDEEQTQALIDTRGGTGS